MLRPIGHISSNLQILAVSISYRMRMAAPATSLICWVDDDGCVYIASADHQRASAMQRHAPEQRINTYRKPKRVPFPLTTNDIVADLQQARSEQAHRHLQQATEALCA